MQYGNIPQETNRASAGKRLMVLVSVAVLMAATLLAICTPFSAAQGQSQGQKEQNRAGKPKKEPIPAVGYDPGLKLDKAYREAFRLLAKEGLRGPALVQEFKERGERFSEEENVFLDSAIELNNLRDPEKANATVPLYRGIGPDGKADEEYIITEASDWGVAKVLGVNYSPKLVNARGSGGDQRVKIKNGRMAFRGAVDFGPELSVTPGPEGQDVVPGTDVFPPADVQPGAVADDQWSSAVVLPSGLVLNVQTVANDTGLHDRVVDIEPEERQVTLQLLDGFQGGDQLYYHFVTDSSDMGAAAIERGVYAPRLNNLPQFGESKLGQDSALLGFSPNINGIEEIGNPEVQGLNYTVASDGQDPINVFPLDPDNDRFFNNNYSPMWDAHVNQWTQEAVDENRERRITGFEDLRNLVDEGQVESGAISPEGEGNPFVAGLRPTNIIINCPVIAQPFEQNENEADNDPTT